VPDTSSAAAGRTVLIAGATSSAGVAVALRLARAGTTVIAVGSNAARLEVLKAQVSAGADAAVFTEVCDLADSEQVNRLAMRVRREHGPVDGLIHLVGGWRGGGGLSGQSDEDWDFLHERIITTLRNTTRAFNDHLLEAPSGRLAIVSSVTVDAPAPGGANYAAAKAASETWLRAVGHGFARVNPTAAAVIFVVRALEGLEPVLADAVAALWDQDAASVNNSRIRLGE
jgi:3-oxoacyl-[acyl-carrier protein] reductase